MNYTLRQLVIFKHVCDAKSITKASEILHLTQPAVSIQLKNFQDQFALPLFELVGRRLFITDFGTEIYHACQEILASADRMEQTMQAYTGKLTGKIKMSVVSTGKYVMPYFLTDFLAENEGVELVMDVTNKSTVVKSLEKNEVDFSLVSILPEHLQLNFIELMQNELYLVGGKDCPLDESNYQTDLLTQLPIIFREQGSGTRQTMERFLHEHKLNVKNKLELASNEAVKQAVLAGLGYSIMPLIGIKNELKSGALKIIPVKGLPITSNWYLIWLKTKQFLPSAKAFLKHIEQHKADIIKAHFDFSKTDHGF
jgi:LysR family transcriptional regulator, low CO2-responsive transcriptional regulator